MLTRLSLGLRDGRIGGALTALADLFYPPHCVACRARGAWLCDDCLSSVVALRPPLCVRCGWPVASAGICDACRQSRSQLSGVRSVSLHEGALRKGIHALKYGGVRVLAGPLADAMAKVWWREPFPAHLIVPVPLHRARLRHRGHDQSLLLARELRARIGLPVRSDLLTRTRNTRSQVGLPSHERWANVSGAFHCAGPALRGANVLLVDDVLTTGATLEASAAALREGGAGDVWALTLTRAGPSATRRGATADAEQ